MVTNPMGQTSRMSSSPATSAERGSTDASGYVARSYEAAERCITDYPASATGVAFGAGLGIGLCLGLALKSAILQRRRSQQRLAERLGHQVLEAVSSVLPETLTSRMRS